jgi:signal transduction histidine kinase/ligand-binding sensor domain-containing protein
LTIPPIGRYPDRFALKMSLVTRSFLAGVLLIGLCADATAQVVVDHWSTDNGLPLNSVGSMCQTAEGYLWLITPDGLARFDGVRFTTFDKSNTEGIEGNRFCCGYCTHDGGFWAASESSGVTRYDHGKFHTYTIRDGLPSSSINGMTGDSKGNVWVLSLGMVSRWDPAARRFVPDQSGDRYDTELGSAGQGFYGIEGDQLRVFLRGKRTVYHLPARVARPLWVGIDVNDQVWMASDNRIVQFGEGQPSVRISEESPRRFHSDYRDSQGRKWGVEFDWNVEGSYVQSILVPDNTPSKIQVRTLFEDREGGLWIGTDGHGLYRLRSSTIRVSSTEQGLADKNIYTILQTHDGAIWIGTWSGGLSRFQGGKFTTYTTAQGLASDRIFSLGEDSEGVLWVSVSGGLYRMKNNRFEKFSVPVLNSGDQTIRAIYADAQGVMWFGTNQGLLRFDHGTWRVLNTADGLAGDDVRVIIPAKDGGLWIGGYGGLARFKDGRLQAWTKENGLPANTVRSLYEDVEGVLWIGTYDGGLGRYTNGRFTRFTTSEGLFNDGVFQILEDSRSNLWMSSNRGIYRVDKRQLTDFAAGKIRAINSIAYGRQDGLKNIECNGGLWPAGMRAQDGSLWFPTQDGAAVIDSENLPQAPNPPAAIIESYLIDHAPGGAERPVRIAPGHGNLEIQYTAPSLVNSENILFRYQLSGLDSKWVAAGTRRTAYYPHLPPGSYTFRVSAAHSDGVWSDIAASLPIVVVPAFYQTWWFDALLVAAAIGVMSFGWQYRIRQLQDEALAQHNFTRRLIESQENERKRIASELHDSLGQRLVIIKNRALMLLQPRAGAPSLGNGQREQLEEISSQTSEAVREVREITYDLRPYRLDRLGLTATLQAMIEAASAGSSTLFSCEIDEVDDVLDKQDEISLYRIIQECVNNVLKHSQAAEAFVRVRRTEKGMELTVRDNGCGFLPKAAKNDPLGGFGLTGIAERAQLLGGKASIHSAPGHGTTVTIEVHSGK